MENTYANPQHQRKAADIMTAFNRASMTSEATGYRIDYAEGRYTVKLRIKGLRRWFSHSTHRI